MTEQNEVQTLLELGLTSRQARIFISLSKYDALTARALATALDLPRQDSYAVLDELETLGLVQKQLDVPTKFVAVSMEDALIILLDRRLKQVSDLEKSTKSLIEKFKSQNLRAVHEEQSKVFLIAEGEPYILRIQKSIARSQSNIDIVSSNNLPQGVFFMREDLERAANRGVKIRCIGSVLGGNDSEVFRRLLNYAFFEIRKIPEDRSWARFCIYDKRELSMALSLTKDFAKSSLLWSNCPNIVEAYQDHFELMWSNAAPDNQSKKRRSRTIDLTDDLPEPFKKKDKRRYVESIVS